MHIFGIMKLSKRFCLKSLLNILLLTVFSGVHAQQAVENVSIVVPAEKVYNWYVQELPFWGAKLQFPEEPESKVKEIYTEKGVMPQKSYVWMDYKEELTLEASFYKLPEVINAKNEKRLIDAAVNRIAVIHGGYPALGSGLTNLQGIREFLLEIKTLKGAALKAKLFAEGDQLLIVTALIGSKDNEIIAQAKYFLDKITFNPLPGEVVKEAISGKSSAVKPQAVWDSLSVENFTLAFPRYPIAQHKVLNQNGTSQRYYEWYMGDGQVHTTFMLSLMPLSNFSEKEFSRIVTQAIETSLKVTDGETVSQRNLDYFKYPLEEVVFKTDQQYFRVRYFSDGKYLYQLLVSGKKESIYQPDANRFLDGLKWKE